MKLPSLKVLWLHDNPCAQIENYREIVIKHLPNLMKLDNNSVSIEEKTASQQVCFNLAAFDENEPPNAKPLLSSDEKLPKQLPSKQQQAK